MDIETQKVLELIFPDGIPGEMSYKQLVLLTNEQIIILFSDCCLDKCLTKAEF